MKTKLVVEARLAWVGAAVEVLRDAMQRMRVVRGRLREDAAPPEAHPDGRAAYTAVCGPEDLRAAKLKRPVLTHGTSWSRSQRLSRHSFLTTGPGTEMLLNHIDGQPWQRPRLEAKPPPGAFGSTQPPAHSSTSRQRSSPS